MSHNLRDLHIYKGLNGERNRAENREKLLLNFNKNYDLITWTPVVFLSRCVWLLIRRHIVFLVWFKTELGLPVRQYQCATDYNLNTYTFLLTQ